MIAIIDCGSGNLQSVQNALQLLGWESVITSQPDKILAAEKIIFPGVGNFGYVMQQLRKKQLDTVITEINRSEIPFLGICVGLQILFQTSEESPEEPGLGIFSGKVVQFTQGKVPQIGWNRIEPRNTTLLSPGYAYFVNSYYGVPQNNDIIIGKSYYFTDFLAAVQRDNITAVQFHPEKSGPYGLAFLERWLSC